MIKKLLTIMLIILIDLILSITLPFTYNNLSYFKSMLIIILIPVLCILIKDKKIYFIILLILSLIYDLIYSEIYLLIFSILTIITIFNYFYYKKAKVTIYTFILSGIISIILYDLILFITLNIIRYTNNNLIYLFYKISHSLILNLLYLIIIYFVLINSRKLEFKKRFISNK